MKYYTVGEHFFDVLGIRLRRGRFFNKGDTASSPRVALINETMARRFWPGQDPLDKQIFRELLAKSDPPEIPLQVIGVVEDGSYNAVGEPPQPFLFLPWVQGSSWMALMVETEVDPATVTASVRREIRALQSDVDLFRLTTLRETIRSALHDREATAEVAGCVSLLGLVLAGIGLCGVVSYAVNQRTREIGIRMAVGATRREVLGMILGEQSLMALAGLGGGALLGLATGRLLEWRGKLFGVSSVDPSILLGASILLVAAALLACYSPARRAARVDPMVALRYE